MLSKENNMPYYLQIYKDLRSSIESGVFKPGELLPSENQLVEEYKVTRATVRAALNMLKEKGIIHTEKGKGSFVNPPKVIQKLNKLYTFGKHFDGSGYDVENEILESYVEECNSFLKNILKLEDKEAVLVVKILRKLGGVPTVFQITYLPVKILSDISSFDVSKESIYEFLERRYGLHMIRAKEYLDPIVADECHAKILGVEVNTPLFLTERITYAEGDVPVEYRECYIRNDKVRFSVELY